MRYLLLLTASATFALAGCGGNATPSIRTSYNAFASAPAMHVMRPMKLGETAPRATPVSNMTYHGGPVQLTPTVYLVLWGFTGKARDPYGEGPYLQKFLSGVGGSTWLGTLTQYYSYPGRKHVANPSNQLVNTWTDSAFVPLHPSQDQVGAEAARAQNHFNDFGPDVMFFIALPAKHDPTYFLGGKYCAYHSWASNGSRAVVYTAFPYNTDFSFKGYSCGSDVVNGSNGKLDGASIVGGHELAESQTDPFVSAWYDVAPTGEVADKCAWMLLKDIVLPTGSFPTQGLWSNRLRKCTQG